jgi:hypothetical protein
MERALGGRVRLMVFLFEMASKTVISAQPEAPKEEL